MISRPICAGPITGIFLGLFYGDIIGGMSIGLMAGALLELIWIAVLPIGGAIPPDASLASVLATSLGVFLHKGMAAPSFPIMMLSLAVSVPAGVVSAKADFAIRKFNIRLVHWADFFAKMGSTWGVELINWIGVFLIFLKAFLLLFLSYFVGITLLEKIIGLLPHQIIGGLSMARTLLLLLGMSVLLELFRTPKLLLKYFFIGFIMRAILIFIWGLRV